MDLFTRYQNLPIQADIAKGIWLNSCSSDDASTAPLSALYPFLMKEFQSISKCQQRQPSLLQLQPLSLKKGGIYDITVCNGSYIKVNKFEKYYTWFIAMCGIIKDLKQIYDDSSDPLMSLFVAKTVAQGKEL